MKNKKTTRAEEARRSYQLMKRLLLGFKARLDEELRDQQVTTAQLRFLKEIEDRPGSSGAMLARACYVTPQSAQAMLVRAVEHGWVVRGKDAENERVVTTRLTVEGERLLAHADGILARLEATVWGTVSRSEMQAMNETMERALRTLED